MKVKFLILFFLISYNQILLSQTCCSGGVPLSNNIGLPFLEKGASQIGVFYDYNNLNTLNEGERKLNDNSRKRITNSILLNFSYNFTDRFLVEGLLSWVNQQRDISQSGTVNFEETKGFGDGVFLFRYLFLNQQKQSLSFGLGGKIPIGSTKEVNKQGILLNADLQPGSNAFDFIFTSTYSTSLQFRKSMSFILRSTYRNTGVNSEYLGITEYEFGDEFQCFIGVSDRFLVGKELVDVSLLFKYRNATSDKLNNNIVANTGGNWVFFNPSVSFQILPSVNFSTRIDVPIYSIVTGLQLTPTFRINTGFSIQILRQKEIKVF
jgi:hypothetical protein